MTTLIANSKKLYLLSLVFYLIVSPVVYAETTFLNPDHTKNILTYIENTWHNLERSTLNCKSLIDAKTNVARVLYLPSDVAMPQDLNELSQKCALIVKRLPMKIQKLGDIDIRKIEPHGLLYLPNSYIVPGGIFNEMYGWDSYFIILGLIQNDQLKMAFNMLENFFYEIEHYGGVLNGNRTYYLTRSQPPFLTSMIRTIYEADTKREFTNLTWLAKAYVYAQKDYQLWTTGEHLAGDTKLSRYFDFGRGPVPELTDTAESYYVDITKYFLLHANTLGHAFLKQTGETSVDCKETKRNVVYRCRAVKDWHLNGLFYRGDRAMRESGFDTSFRFGAYSADTTRYAPLDLNSLLYKAETDLEWMSHQLGLNNDKQKWQDFAAQRRSDINKYFWDEKKGLYFDYHFVNKRTSNYIYATTFYPLWTGIATQAQAARVVKNLAIFEKDGGLLTSPYHTGVQWDAPYGWAPIQLIAIKGLQRYGYQQDATRIAHKFLQMVLDNYLEDKTIREKYDVIKKTAKTDIKVGYKENMIGFGWTNGVFLVLLKEFNKLPAVNNKAAN